jgi:hypothetical protein
MPVITMQVDTVMTHINTLYFESDFHSLQNKFFLLFSDFTLQSKFSKYKNHTI